MSGDTKRAAVLHPDLGIGGAERLIVDATCALINAGYQTEVFTSYYDEKRCFEETKQFNITVLGSWIPRSIMGRFCALMAYIKMIYIASYIVLYRKNLDLILCDQVSACIPILKLGLNECKIVFYCHFPDQLLTSRQTLLKKAYRSPLDRLEEWSTGLADHILVNSEFTLGVVKETFKSLKYRNIEVLHPCVRVDQSQQAATIPDIEVDTKGTTKKKRREKMRDRYVFLSLNRFERKKNIGLAIEALRKFLDAVRDGLEMKAHLIVAGGYDERLRECVRYYAELERLVDKLNLNSRVKFVLSPDDREKNHLIQTCDAVIYTPSDEHFGIVPLEAMLAKKPVIATASGGPTETIVHEITGFLCDPDKKSFADSMQRLVFNPEWGELLGDCGRRRVEKLFSFETFSDKLIQICSNKLSHKHR